MSLTHLSGQHAGDSPQLPRAVVGLGLALFFTAMGANAFVQFVVAYLVTIKGWSSDQATLILILAFTLMPLARLGYNALEQRLGEYGVLVLGSGLFMVWLGLLQWGAAPWVIGPAAVALSFAGTLVFTAGPLRILAATPASQHGVASGLYFASNFLAWFVSVTVQGQVVRRLGFEPTLWVAWGASGVGLLLLLALPRYRQASALAHQADWLAPLRSGRYRLVMGFMALSAVAFGLMFGSLAQSITLTFGVDLTAIALSGFYLARLPGSLFAGWLVQRYGEHRLLAVTFGFAGLTLLAVSVNSQHFPLTLGAILALGFQQATVPVAAMALVGSAEVGNARQTGFGLLFAASELGVAFALTLGQVAGNWLGNAGAVCLVFGALYGLGSLAAWRLRQQ